jgi:hypothetical protein
MRACIRLTRRRPKSPTCSRSRSATLTCVVNTDDDRERAAQVLRRLLAAVGEGLLVADGATGVRLQRRLEGAASALNEPVPVAPREDPN